MLDEQGGLVNLEGGIVVEPGDNVIESFACRCFQHCMKLPRECSPLEIGIIRSEVCIIRNVGGSITILTLQWLVLILPCWTEMRRGKHDLYRTISNLFQSSGLCHDVENNQDKFLFSFGLYLIAALSRS